MMINVVTRELISNNNLENRKKNTLLTQTFLDGIKMNTVLVTNSETCQTPSKTLTYM